MSLYSDVVERGILHDNHYSDLYLPFTEETLELVRRHGRCYSLFTNQVEGGSWIDVPFAYDPYWAGEIESD